VRRKPNPWIATPAIVLGLLAGALAWVVTSVSCELSDPTGGCVLWSVVMSAAALALVTSGTAVILTLAYRSLAEWREQEAKSQEQS
jgi:hypothetical protein